MQSKTLSTVAHPELALARKPADTGVPIELVLRQPTFASAISLCVQISGLDDKEVYLSLSIDAGHWTRIMKGDAHFPVNKLSDVMDLCGNEAPLLWMVHNRGYDTNDLRKRETETEKKLRLAEEHIDRLETLARVRDEVFAQFISSRRIA